MTKRMAKSTGADFATYGAIATRLHECCVAELDRADAMLALCTGPQRHYGVHQARKAMRRARAALRLARDDLGPRCETCDKALRHLCRQLSGARDAQAAVETFDRLARHDGLPTELRTALTGQRLRQAQALLRDDPGLAHLRRALARVRKRAQALPWRHVRPATPVRTFAHSMHQADRALRRVPQGTHKRHRLRRRLRRWQMQHEMMSELASARPALPARPMDNHDRARDKRAHLLARERDLCLLRDGRDSRNNAQVRPNTMIRKEE